MADPRAERERFRARLRAVVGVGVFFAGGPLESPRLGGDVGHRKRRRSRRAHRPVLEPKRVRVGIIHVGVRDVVVVVHGHQGSRSRVSDAAAPRQVFEDDVRRERLADDANGARLERVLANGEGQIQNILRGFGRRNLPRLVQHAQRLDVPGLDLVRHAGADDDEGRRGETATSAAAGGGSDFRVRDVDARVRDERAVVAQHDFLLLLRTRRNAREPNGRRARLRVEKRGRRHGDVRQRALAAQLERDRRRVARAVANRRGQRRGVFLERARREDDGDKGVLARFDDERLGPGKQRHGERNAALVSRDRGQRDVHDALHASRVGDFEVGSHSARGERRRSLRRRGGGVSGGVRVSRLRVFAVALRVRLRRRLRVRVASVSGSLHLRGHRAEAERAVPPGVHRGDGAARADGEEGFALQVGVQLAFDHLVLLKDAGDGGFARVDARRDALAVQLVRDPERLVARVAVGDVQTEQLGKSAVVRGGEPNLEAELRPGLDHSRHGRHDERAEAQRLALRFRRRRRDAALVEDNLAAGAAVVPLAPAVIEREHLERERAVVGHVEEPRADLFEFGAGQVRAEIHPATRRERVLGEGGVDGGVDDDAFRRAALFPRAPRSLGLLQQTRRVARLLRARGGQGQRGLRLLLRGLELGDGQHDVRRVHQLGAASVRIGRLRDVEHHRALRRGARLELARRRFDRKHLLGETSQLEIEPRGVLTVVRQDDPARRRLRGLHQPEIDTFLLRSLGVSERRRRAFALRGSLRLGAFALRLRRGGRVREGDVDVDLPGLALHLDLGDLRGRVRERAPLVEDAQGEERRHLLRLGRAERERHGGLLARREHARGRVHREARRGRLLRRDQRPASGNERVVAHDDRPLGFRLVAEPATEKHAGLAGRLLLLPAVVLGGRRRLGGSLLAFCVSLLGLLGRGLLGGGGGDVFGGGLFVRLSVRLFLASGGLGLGRLCLALGLDAQDARALFLGGGGEGGGGGGGGSRLGGALPQSRLLRVKVHRDARRRRDARHGERRRLGVTLDDRRDDPALHAEPFRTREFRCVSRRLLEIRVRRRRLGEVAFRVRGHLRLARLARREGHGGGENREGVLLAPRLAGLGVVRRARLELDHARERRRVQHGHARDVGRVRRLFLLLQIPGGKLRRQKRVLRAFARLRRLARLPRGLLVRRVVSFVVLCLLGGFRQVVDERPELERARALDEHAAHRVLLRPRLHDPRRAVRDEGIGSDARVLAPPRHAKRLDARAAHALERELFVEVARGVRGEAHKNHRRAARGDHPAGLREHLGNRGGLRGGFGGFDVVAVAVVGAFGVVFSRVILLLRLRRGGGVVLRRFTRSSPAGSLGLHGGREDLERRDRFAVGARRARGDDLAELVRRDPIRRLGRLGRAGGDGGVEQSVGILRKRAGVHRHAKRVLIGRRHRP